MNKSVVWLTFVLLATVAFSQMPSAQADSWVPDHAEYDSNPPNPTGTEHSVSSTSPNIMGNATVSCGGQGSAEFGWSPVAAEIYDWSGTGTPTAGFLCLPTCNVDGSIINSVLYGFAASSSDIQGHEDEMYANGTAPQAPDYAQQYQDNSSNHGGATGFTVFVPEGATVVNVPCDLSVDAQVSLTSGCVGYPSASAYATARAWVTF